MNAMNTWTSEQLDRIGSAREMRIAGRRRDGSLRNPVIVWMVRSDDGEEALYRDIDEAYRVKYGRNSSPVAAITSAVARSTTLKLVPQDSRKDT
jgi:hypothetical protein